MLLKCKTIYYLLLNDLNKNSKKSVANLINWSSQNIFLSCGRGMSLLIKRMFSVEIEVLSRKKLQLKSNSVGLRILQSKLCNYENM